MNRMDYNSARNLISQNIRLINFGGEKYIKTELPQSFKNQNYMAKIADTTVMHKPRCYNEYKLFRNWFVESVFSAELFAGNEKQV